MFRLVLPRDGRAALRTRAFSRLQGFRIPRGEDNLFEARLSTGPALHDPIDATHLGMSMLCISGRQSTAIWVWHFPF